MYVEELIGPKTVNTMPAETVAAFQEHGKVAQTITEGVAEARKLLERLAEVGVDYDDVVATLEAEGVKFADSFEELLDGIAPSEPSSRLREFRRRADLGLRRVALDRPARTAGSAGSTSSRGCAPPRRAERVLRGRGRAVRRRRPARHGRLVARPRGDAADVRRRVVPRPRHDPSGGDPPARARRRPRATLFLASSKSGSTIETRSHRVLLGADRGRGSQFGDHRPGLRAGRARARAWLPRRLPGRAEIGGRYSALSMFGIVPAALMGVDLGRFLDGAAAMVDACRGEDGNPGSSSASGSGRAGGRAATRSASTTRRPASGSGPSSCSAESTGKQGKDSCPRRASRPDGPDRQPAELELAEPYDLGGEFFRWEFATAVAGTCSGSTRSTSPTCRRRRTGRTRCSRPASRTWSRAARSTTCSQAQAGRDYVCIQAFVDPAREDELAPLVERAHATGCVVTKGLGPRYLHSTGQLHKGGPNTGLFVQVVDETGDELPIPGREFGFGRLIRSQAAGDLRRARGARPPCRPIRLEDV